MARAANGSVSIRYEIDGSGPAVLFVGDIGLGAWQFGWQHAAIAGPYAAITPELRGIGESDAPPGPYDIDDLVADLDAVLTAEGRRRVHLVGYGFGGMLALAYALSSSRPRSLTVVGTSATGDAYNPEALWADPNDRAAVDASVNALLSPDFREARPDVSDRIAEWRVREDAPRESFEAQRAALSSFDIGDRLYELTTPTLVLHGEADAICPAHYGRSLSEGLPGGEFHAIEGAGHFAGVEASARVNDELIGWLAEHADQ
ncbi:alpha/beta fold hydrolase [Halopenitus sp. H-Gu1]|uniref:alpha/beta fold hydrolase n=1 Tax=Halopenitus sp. H-Gu1 TaxID=3242697 RepID=UPI00359E4814